MRHYWLRLKRGAIGVAFAATCVSTLNFTGCMKPSGRDLSSDISQDAGQAALEAEREVEERKELEALIADAQRQKEKEQRLDMATVAKREDADAPVRENPLAAFLRRRETHDTSDPFLAEAEKTRAAEADAIAEADDSDKMLASHQDRTPIQRANQHTETAQQPNADTATTAWDDLLQEHLNRNSNGHILAESKPPRTNPIEVNKPSHSDQSNELARPFPGRQRTQPESLATRAGMNAFGPSEEIAQSQSERVSGVQTTPHEDVPLSDSNKIRVQSLLLTAYAQEGRGDLQAAYRSAVSALTIADEYGVEFTREEEDPRNLANTLSERLWGHDPSSTAKTVQPDPEAFRKTQVAQPQQPLNQQIPVRQAPAYRTPVPRSSKHDSTFSQRSDSDWQPLPPTADHAWRTNEAPIATPPLQAPGFERGTFSAPQTQFSPQPTPPPRVEWNQPNSTSRGPLEASHTPSWDSAQVGLRSELAHVHASQSATANEADNVEYALAQAASAHSADPRESHQLFPAQLDTIEAAPPSHAKLITNEVVAASDRAWPVDESVLADSEIAAETLSASQPSKTRWGVIGFIIALLSAIIGLRLSSKKRDDETKTPEEAEQSSEGNSDEQASHSLRIKRAA